MSAKKTFWELTDVPNLGRLKDSLLITLHDWSDSEKQSRHAYETTRYSEEEVRSVVNEINETQPESDWLLEVATEPGWTLVVFKKKEELRKAA